MNSKYWAFPTWAVAMVAIRFHMLSKGHPWYGRTLTLSNWHAAQTKVCRQFDLIFWTYFVLLVCLALNLLRRILA